MLPSGDPVWVRVQVPTPAATGERTPGPVDVGLGKPIDSTVEALRLPGFAETIHGVVASVRGALSDHRPDSFSVEFGIEITARAGGLLSVLAEVGGTAQVKVTASWDRSAPAKPPIPGEEPERG